LVTVSESPTPFSFIYNNNIELTQITLTDYHRGGKTHQADSSYNIVSTVGIEL